MGPDATNAPEQSMTLVDACLPPLAAGKYEVTARQTVTHEGKEISGKAKAAPAGKPSEAPTFSKSSEFWVSAPRFTLASSEIYAMYPPADARGRFSDALPHVVLRRRTLPWEREPAAPAGAPAGPRRPWMVLLLLDEDDLGLHAAAPLRTESRPLSEVLGPGRTREPWERDDDRCTTLDLPAALFARIAPTWDDLPYLAHARHVGSTAHMEADGIDDQGWFSVVVGNRTPTPGKEHVAYLVSVEGLETRLPPATGSPKTDDQPPVRLVVLASWRFVDETDGTSIRDLAAGLKCGALRLPPPARAAGTNGGPAVTSNGGPKVGPGEIVARALEDGYAPLEHRTRQGQRTVSWYRGPLVPQFLPTEPRNIVYSCADAALRYDRYTGLLDVSHAAAWQLGRLLALRDAPFARAIHRLKLGAVQRAAKSAVQRTLAERFGGDASDWNALAVRFLAANPPAEPETEQRPQVRTPADRPDPSETLRTALQSQAPAAEIPFEVRQFLGRLFLLHGVSLGYLVPHPEMLPRESLRVFYLDTSWLASLLDGALSIGRVSRSLLFLDKAMTGRFLADVVRDEVKAGVMPAKGVTDAGADLGDPNIEEVVGHLTGFLLRSQLVSGWRGLELRAEDDREVLRPLRLQRVAPDTLLGLYHGQLRRLVITQPPQGVHFAAPAGAPRRTETRALDLGRLAADRGLTGQPARLAGELLVKRVQHTIEVDITTARPRAS
jgi:hypothetical protein